jgi:putative FmdB family regulatory protein
MPTYVFKCAPNSHQFEVTMGFTDPNPQVCAVCGEAPVKKVFMPVGVSFKGSGFYKTDSRGSSSAASTPPAGDSAGGSTSGSSDSSSSTGSSGSSTPAAPATPATPAAPSTPAN